MKPHYQVADNNGLSSIDFTTDGRLFANHYTYPRQGIVEFIDEDKNGSISKTQIPFRTSSHVWSSYAQRINNIIINDNNRFYFVYNGNEGYAKSHKGQIGYVNKTLHLLVLLQADG